MVVWLEGKRYFQVQLLIILYIKKPNVVNSAHNEVEGPIWEQFAQKQWDYIWNVSCELVGNETGISCCTFKEAGECECMSLTKRLIRFQGIIVEIIVSKRYDKSKKEYNKTGLGEGLERLCRENIEF